MRVLPLLLSLALATVPAACARQSVPPDQDGAEAPPADTRGGSSPVAVIVIVGLLTVVLIGAAISSADDPWDDLESRR